MERKRATIRRYADIPISTTTWLWPGYVPYGELTLVEGLPASGKSSLVLDVVARYTRAEPMPECSDASQAGSVLMLAVEDDPGRTIKPRLIAAGADPARVHDLLVVHTDTEDRPLRLPDDVALIEEQIREHKIGLVVIDALMSTISGCTTEQRIRAALTPLVQLAQRRNVAIIGIRHHTKSKSNATALTRGIGGIAFAALARSILTVAKLGDDQFAIAIAKSNLGIDDVPAQGFRIVDVEDGHSSRVEWTGSLDYSADDLIKLSSAAKISRGVQRERARQYLSSKMATCAVAVTEIEADAKELGLAMRTIRRAADELGIAKTKIGNGVGGCWVWSLPVEDGQVVEPEDGHLRLMS